MKIIKEENGIILAENEITGLFHVVEISWLHYQVKSLLPSDRPKPGNGNWISRVSDRGLEYVSKGRSKKNAQRLFRQEVKKEKEKGYSFFCWPVFKGAAND